ncbi:LOW QUALITY PROTEIN: protein FAM83G-like [Salmo salar]|uniref:LOW QUALITY PROTEIN: protein FAM83G-like n=1 Tax=Salmo salar TaxID=8030 RepID=A0ABM3EGF4_SALSA|nr:LOW QUALITY PROTEIN: protein FAM83G-like [Salmo salar]
MALSQIQCLDENNVNLRTNESKPDFFYSEEQRLALEILLRDGSDAFNKFLHANNLRCFLSDQEVDRLTRSVEEVCDPESELSRVVDSDSDELPVSLQYWPELSACSLPRLDLGWPDCASYRGVTRVTVYAQPPLDGYAHIKEMVRKTIAQAQKVIAVVMDQFTDVDIFRDLLEACFKRKVSVYILLERAALPHFLSMAERAAMHPGHLKSLRVGVTGGAEFLSRSCSRVRGRLGHRLLLVDGDKAVSGSYRYPNL